MICFAGNLGDPTGERAYRVFDPVHFHHFEMFAEFPRIVKWDNYLSGGHLKARFGNSWALGAAPARATDTVSRARCVRAE